MDYSVLSPHVGTWALRDHHLGDASLRGGAINWGNVGSRLSSALSSTGRWLSNAGHRFVNSNTFQQIKKGFNDSGVVQNVANLAGETLNSLTEIGRLKLQQDIDKLRRRALGEDGGGAASQAELLALVQALQAQLAAGEQPPAGGPSAPMVPTTRPMPEMVTPVGGPRPVTLDLPPGGERPPAAKRRRKRPAYWRDRLSTLSGTGVATSSRRLCY
ncbi:capsid protein precursor pVI [Pigeon adenovirus 1]|uniref:Capsid protein pVI n=1 Tax=Pigeon adenovirus 1 TaxID=764030 RepID=X5M4W5_9ADEN|nr:capsid protein precursor pVI [Pigeon adenovirus 1]QUS52952.1 capsid protein precursor pVI [Pigeon adenovirus 1]CDO33903.1 capsid protein precursor pVI [Pigeon adenovirus 1]